VPGYGGSQLRVLTLNAFFVISTAMCEFVKVALP
jgi:hypothetical protein